jgi:NAD(P)-dependent dehydrogenase (short-subunit alcohol dehydrogenase family)
MGEFDGLVAVVTGGASGIGATTAAMMLQRGGQVAVLDRVTNGVPTGALSVGCDVADTASVDAAISAVIESFGRLDILVNNAGIGAVGDVAANDDDEWARVLDVNVIGMARVARAALAHLRQSAHAAVVNTCSAVAFLGVRQRALYSASKGAIEGLTLAMAADHVREGIRVNAVAPGTTMTPWVDRLLEASVDRVSTEQALRERQPLGRLVTAEEVAHAICYLASPLSASTTGAILRVDGGMASLRL